MHGWSVSSSVEEIHGARVQMQSEILRSIMEGRSSSRRSPLEKAARKYELQAFLAADSLEDYLSDCKEISKSLPQYSTIPPYSSFQHVRSRIEHDSQTKENDSASTTSNVQALQALHRLRKEEQDRNAEEGDEAMRAAHSLQEAAEAVLVLRNSFQSAVTPVSAKRSHPSNSRLSPPFTPLPRFFPDAATEPKREDSKSGEKEKAEGTVQVGNRIVNSPIGPGKACTCTKSSCLKMYCGCFAGSVYCDETCKCLGCKNTVEHEKVRQNAITKTLLRYPNAFAPKAAKSLSCTCKRSRCLKMYCDCFAAKSYCGDRCRCTACANFDGSAPLIAAQGTFHASLKRKSPSSDFSSNTSSGEVQFPIKKPTNALTLTPRVFRSAAAAASKMKSTVTPLVLK